jgi:hypothetical protein
MEKYNRSSRKLDLGGWQILYNINNILNKYILYNRKYYNTKNANRRLKAGIAHIMSKVFTSMDEVSLFTSPEK